jgi:hypothetical protein
MPALFIGINAWPNTSTNGMKAGNPSKYIRLINFL